MTDQQLSIVVGFFNYADVQSLEKYLQDTNVTILSAVQDAQRAFSVAEAGPVRLGPPAEQASDRVTP